MLHTTYLDQSDREHRGRDGRWLRVVEEHLVLQGDLQQTIGLIVVELTTCLVLLWTNGKSRDRRCNLHGFAKVDVCPLRGGLTFCTCAVEL